MRLKNPAEWPTGETRVADFEVGLEILGARLRLGEERVRYGDLARLPPGAARVRQLGHVRRTADVSVVDLGTAAEPHAAVERVRDDDDVAGRLARRVERLRLAVRLVRVLRVRLLMLLTTTLIRIAPVCNTPHQYTSKAK